jgi:GTP-binding protein EngB required for normal cell division
MNENHQRHLLATFQHVDNLLSEADHILASAGSASPFQEYSQDSTPVQRKVTHDYILRVRETMRRILEDLELPPKPPVSGALWAARNHTAFAGIAVTEIEPEHMLGYGKLSDEDRQTLDRVVAELNSVLNRLNTYLAQGTDADLQTRLQRLEQTRDEVKLLRELERIITAHGLVEFRVTLTLLLDRLETNAFEIGAFGRVSSGKSSLLNHLLGGEFLPVGVTPVTAVPTRISFGPQPQATIEFAESKPQAVELSDLAEFSTEQQNPGNTKHVTRVHVQVPAKRLYGGVTFVDTPGLGSLATSGAEETVAYLPRCDLGIVLLDAGAALTQEDLVVIQSLYRAGATAMVLVSKADLLAPSDRERMITYVRQHLRSELNLDLPVHPVSVVAADTRLCDEWFEQELRPLLESHQENAVASLKRKIGGLREAVERILETRLESARGGEALVAPTSVSQRKEAAEALRNADAILETAQRSGDSLAYKIRSLTEQAIEAVADDVAVAWSKAGEKSKTSAEIVSDSLSQIISSQGAKCVAALAQVREQLAQTLQSAHRASGVTREPPETLPEASGLPLIDVSPITRMIAFKRPALLPIFGRAVLRSYVRQQLKQQLGDGLPEFLGLAGKQLEQWYRRALTELQKDFAASAGIYRAQFQQLSGAASGESELQKDLDVLKKWPFR